MEDLSDEEEDSSNEANEDVAAETEDNAEDSANEAAGNINIIVSGSFKNVRISGEAYPTTAKRVQRVV